MEVRVWKSFSCNNSSSYRLVARFDDPAVAKDAAQELSEFFTNHAARMDELTENGDFPEAPPETQTALGEKYGFEWEEVLTWGDDVLSGDEPSVTAEGEVLVVWHTYCGGFADVPTYLKARGAREVESEERSTPPVSLLFRLPANPSAALENDLNLIFMQVAESPNEVEPLRTPWKGRRDAYGTASVFRDAKTVGMYLPSAPEDLGVIKAWLTARGIESPSIRLCEYADEKRFAAFAVAKCAACGGPLEYLDPRLHGTETEHLSCTACGGMFDAKPIVDAFKPPSE